jgi:hypothetical protein
MPPPSEPRSIFISYRRDDAGGEAGRLFDDLTRAFGADTVFMDVAGIQPGTDFRKAIDANVASAGVLLAIVGPTWLTIADANGSRRLEDPNDFVRLEIASALARNIPVIPVLVHAATMPHADALPDDLKDLAYRNAVELTLARWNSDVALLVPALKNYVHTEPATAAQTVHATVPVQLPAPESPVIDRAIRSRKPWIYGAGAAAFLLIALAVFFFTRPAPPPTTQSQVALPFNATGIYDDGTPFSGVGVDGHGHAFHPFVKLLAPGTQLMTVHDGTVFLIGPTGANDFVQPPADQPTIIPLPDAPYSTMVILAAGINGTQSAQSFTVNYQDYSANHVVSLSDWTAIAPPRQPGEALILSQPSSNGTQQPSPVGLFTYKFKLANTHKLKSLILPQNPNLVIFAVTLLP